MNIAEYKHALRHYRPAHRNEKDTIKRRVARSELERLQKHADYTPAHKMAWLEWKAERAKAPRQL